MKAPTRLPSLRSAIDLPLSGGGIARPPAHLVHRRSRAPVDGLSGNHETLFFVEANGAEVVGIDVQIESVRGYALGLRQERARDPRAPGLGRNHELVEIET